jgi:hypothetical protein
MDAAFAVTLVLGGAGTSSNADLFLVTDASSTHIGALIQQKQPGQGQRLLGSSQPSWTKLKLITAPSTGSCLL